MRKSFNTIFLILLLIGPSIILSCVRQPMAEDDEQTLHAQDDIKAADDAVVLNAIPYPNA